MIANITGGGFEGRTLRRQLAFAIITPVVFTGLIYWGAVKAGWYDAAFSALLTGLICIIVMTLLVRWATGSLDRIVSERLRAEEALSVSEHRFHSTLDTLMEGCQIIGFDWRYLYVNDTVVRHGRQTREELLGSTMMERYPGIEETELFSVLRDSMENRRSRTFENEFSFPDGGKRWFDLRIQPVPEGIFVLSVDITNRKEAEQCIQKLNRTYAVLSDINQAIVRVREPQVLFERACQIAVDKGDFSLAWLGLVDNDRRKLQPVASAGHANGFLKKIDISLHDEPHEHSPVAESLRSGDHVICNEIQATENLSSYQQAALALGYRSSATFPLKVDDCVRGAVTFYAAQPNFFDNKEVRLLDELAMDISFAMSFAEKEAERERAEALLRESEEMHRIVLENISDAVLITDEKGDFTYICPNVANIFGYSREEVYAMGNVKGLVGADLCRKGDLADSAEVHNIEHSIVDKAGQQHFLLINLKRTSIRGGVFLYSMRDISERKQAEEERARFLATIEEKNKELEQIVYVTSHDLRSPLVNIKGFSKEIMVSCSELDNTLAECPISPQKRGAVQQILKEQIPEALEIIQASTAKMATLLNGLLKLFRLGRATLNIRTLDMNRLVSTIAKTFEFQAKEAGITIEIDALPACRGDETQIGQVFSNLLENALKYVDASHQGRVKVSGYEAEKECVYYVEDNGIGIAKEDQSKIFEIFHRLKPESATGEGLGLTIVNKILERHGGRIRLQSIPGSGSKFIISLPR